MLVYIANVPVIVEHPSNLIDMLGLDELSAKEFEKLEGKHICVDPYAEDIYNTRTLMWADTESELALDYAESCADI